MAKKPKVEAPTKDNQPDAETVRRLFGAIENAQDNIKSTMMAAAAECKPEHQAIRDSKKALRDSGVTASVVEATLKERRAQKTMEKARASLEGGDVKLGEITRAAIGGFIDLPLGRAAVDRAEQTDADRDLRPGFLKEREPTSREKRIAENVAALAGKDGIKTIDAQA